MRVVFYGNEYGGGINKIIRWWTSPFKEKFNGEWAFSFSHVEIEYDDINIFSASQYENLVRTKTYSGTGKAWVKLDLNISKEKEKEIIRAMEKYHGKEYDYFGILGFIIGTPDQRDKWFCSEVCSRVLQECGILSDDLIPEDISPNKLYNILIGILNKG